MPENPDQLLPTDAVYHWSNVRLVALPEVPGTQLVADLEYTADGCTAGLMRSVLPETRRFIQGIRWAGREASAGSDSPWGSLREHKRQHATPS
ncbi:hypothetical protein D187_009947 [Cystobacter fuscus DSM 2262]|uniref:Uncharacterized protein n=1 Tax=Cystobacter fuscus (strain ATCC 25194 / DSM 2262 / NBRC 100088 / M29) TaxID=1242864 RepID=S9QL96_CYSF2|nr:hypothetical protein [Cystobacter fuscus]EPX62044.1 hypothetical protein D187_009947 [Cystobacter fuscus DSM 2262]